MTPHDAVLFALGCVGFALLLVFDDMLAPVYRPGCSECEHEKARREKEKSAGSETSQRDSSGAAEEPDHSDDQSNEDTGS